MGGTYHIRAGLITEESRALLHTLSDNSLDDVATATDLVVNNLIMQI